MKVIKIIGGIGSGKSLVLKLLEQDFFAEIIKADEVAHQLMAPGQEGYDQVVNYFGNKILTDHGLIDRSVLADLLFKDKQAVERVNQMIHPLVWKEIRRRIADKKSGLIVVESALPHEKEHDIYNEIWYVYSLKETRVQRLIDSRGYSREKIDQIMKNQPDEEEYRGLSSRVIDNNGTEVDLKKQLETILRK